jgi:hypothetical protein
VRQAIEEGWTTAELRREINAGYAFSSSRALNITRTVSSQPRALEPGRREVQPEGSVKGRLTAGAPRQLFLRIATTIFAGSSPGLIDIVGPSFGTEVLIFSAASGGAR